jgi:hypothetical protein
MLGASLWPCVAWPPGLACMERAGPGAEGSPSRAQRSASPHQANRPSTQTAIASR